MSLRNQKIEIERDTVMENVIKRNRETRTTLPSE